MFLPFPCSNLKSRFESSAKPVLAFADRLDTLTVGSGEPFYQWLKAGTSLK